MASISSSELHFSVDSHLLLELGERLVARESIALAELVKNAYDADSPDVIITLDKVTKSGGRIIVEDHGEGMTYDMLIKGWMRIATGDKRENPISRKYKRVRVGAKGIGRFACRVLSNKLVLESVAVVGSGRKEKVSAIFDWRDFKTGSSVGEIGISCTRQRVDYKTDTGTKLTLEDARDVWKEDDLNRLQNDLLSLVSDYVPEVQVAEKEEKREDPGFQIIVHAPEFPEFQGSVSEQFLKYSWCRLIGRISPDGKPRYQLRVRRLQKDLQYTPTRTFAEVGGVYFRIDFFVYRREYFAGLPISLNDARNILRERGGVRIFFDKFRVFAYGMERSEDWLSLDLDRARVRGVFREYAEKDEDVDRPFLDLPGTYQLMGAVFLSREKNPGITMSITRDHLLDNKAFQELVKFVRLGIEWMTVQYARFAPESRGGPPRKEDPLKPLEIARQKVLRKEDVLGHEATSEILQSFVMARQAFEEREEDRISEISMLRVLATTGTLISVFEHELSTLIRALITENRRLVNYLEDLPQSHRSKLKDTISRLQTWADSIEETASQLGKMMGRKSRDRPRSYPLRDLIDNMVAPFNYHFETEHIDFKDDGLPADLRMPAMFRCEVYSIFLNLITNAIKAVKNSEVRKIHITGNISENEIRIHVLDTGRGIPPDRREEVFKPFVSDSEPDLLFGEGTGLGLTIVRNTVDTYGGTVRFIDPPDDWKTCVELVFPQS